MVDKESQESTNLPETYVRLRKFVNFVVRLFFRRLKVVGLENVPKDSGGILVAWHPNGLIDPSLMIATFPGQVVFGARHGLFKWPLLGSFMKALGTVPIYRRQDMPKGHEDEQRKRNQESLSALAREIARGSYSALFPEGVSHDDPFMQELKTGAARLFYQARLETTKGQKLPVIIPVGLHYDQKRVFRSSVLVEYHPPLPLSPDLDVIPEKEEDRDSGRLRARELTDRIEESLKDIIMETESWELHDLFHRARKLVRAERAHRAGANPGAARIDEKVLGMARIWKGYQVRKETNPEKVSEMVERVRSYSEDLTALGFEDHELDRSPPLLTTWMSILLVLQFLSVFVVLPPFLFVGYIVNLPPAALLTLVAKFFAKKDKDVATIKMVGGLALFPMVWGLWAALAAWGNRQATSLYPDMMPENPVFAGSLTVVLSIVGAIIMLGYLQTAKNTLRAIKVRFTRNLRTRAIKRLKEERVVLHDEIIALATGLELPGVVREDGRISRKK